LRPPALPPTTSYPQGFLYVPALTFFLVKISGPVCLGDRSFFPQGLFPCLLLSTDGRHSLFLSRLFCFSCQVAPYPNPALTPLSTDQSQDTVWIISFCTALSLPGGQLPSLLCDTFIFYFHTQTGRAPGASPGPLGAGPFLLVVVNGSPPRSVFFQRFVFRWCHTNPSLCTPTLLTSPRSFLISFQDSRFRMEGPPARM